MLYGDLVSGICYVLYVTFIPFSDSQVTKTCENFIVHCKSGYYKGTSKCVVVVAEIAQLGER